MTNTREERVARSPIGKDAKLNELIFLAMAATYEEQGKGYTEAILKRHADHAADLWRGHQAIVEPSPDAWEAIETFAEPTAWSSGCGVLVADADGTVGEAYFRNFGDEDDGWWWANTSRGDYPEPDQPNPTHWRPLPDPPKVTGQ